MLFGTQRGSGLLEVKPVGRCEMHGRTQVAPKQFVKRLISARQIASLGGGL
jgi:hypothetical protein